MEAELVLLAHRQRDGGIVVVNVARRPLHWSSPLSALPPAFKISKVNEPFCISI